MALATDPMNCGACGERCAAGAACFAPSCACPPAQPTVCGAAPGTCCAGAACCDGGACPPGHANGLGQTYHDCGAQDADTGGQALLAADAWSPGGNTVAPYLWCGVPDCICREKGADAAVWCYGATTLSGRVRLTAGGSCTGSATCPFETALPWH